MTRAREVLHRIAEDFGLGLVYLFGSNAPRGQALLEGGAAPPAFSFPRGEQGMSGTREDLDVGVVFLHFPPTHRVRTYGALQVRLSDLFPGFDLDLVFLQQTDPLFQYEAICGINIYRISQDFRDSYEERVLREAADWNLEMILYQREFLEGVEDGYFPFEYSPAHGAAPDSPGIP